MKSYAEVLISFVNEKFGKLSSELLLKKFMKELGIRSLQQLTLEQQIKFANFFIARVLKGHMDNDKIALMKKQLLLKYCLDNAAEAVSKIRYQKIILSFTTFQQKSFSLATTGITPKDFLFSLTITAPKQGHLFFFFDQIIGMDLLNFLSGQRKENYDPSLFEGIKALWEQLLEEFKKYYYKLSQEEVHVTVDPFKPADQQLLLLQQHSSSFYWTSEGTLSINATTYPFRIIFLEGA